MELTSQDRYIKLDGAMNVRHLGGYATQSGGYTAPFNFIRSDSLHALSEQDIKDLTDLKVKHIIDLRREREVEVEANILSDRSEFTYRNISLFPALDPLEYSRRPDILKDLYIQSLHDNQRQYAEVVKVLAKAEQGAVLFHCTMGKDRTGLIAAILLELAGVERNQILRDYAETEGYIAPLAASILSRAAERGIDPESYRSVLRCDKDLLQAALRSVEEKYGTVTAWLIAGGVNEEEISRLRMRLVDYPLTLMAID